MLHQVVLLLEHIVSDARKVGVLQVGVEVDFDDAVADGLLVFLLGGAGAAVEDEEDGLFFRGGGLVFDVFLVWEGNKGVSCGGFLGGFGGLTLSEELRVETDVSGLIDTMDVAEA